MEMGAVSAGSVCRGDWLIRTERVVAIEPAYVESNSTPLGGQRVGVRVDHTMAETR